MTAAKTRSVRDVIKAGTADKALRAEWERTALARTVAIRVVSYRAQQGLSQAALADRLGIKQPAVARLESGDTNPRFETLERLTAVLGLEFLVSIAPRSTRTLLGPQVRRAAVTERVSANGARVVVAAS